MGRKKKEIKIKEPVRIREKRLNDGNVSLYLDMYYRMPPQGCRTGTRASWPSKLRRNASSTFRKRVL